MSVRNLFGEADPDVVALLLDDSPHEEKEIDRSGGRITGGAEHFHDEKAGKAKPKPVSHTSRTKEHYRKQGYIVTHCELVSAYSGNRSDLFGFLDLLAIRPGETLGIQECKPSVVNDHKRKFASTDIHTASGRSIADSVRMWLAAGNRLVVISWEEKKGMGRQKWWPVEEEITEETLAATEARRRKK